VLGQFCLQDFSRTSDVMSCTLSDLWLARCRSTETLAGESEETRSESFQYGSQELTRITDVRRNVRNDDLEVPEITRPRTASFI
jgi:hypothetical protein